MILILSQANNESTTEHVIKWLEFYKQPYKRINGSDFYKYVKVLNGVIQFTDFDFKKVKSIWARRWLDENFMDNILAEDPTLSCINSIKLHENIIGELKRLKQLFDAFLLKSCDKWITFPTEIYVNKLLMLDKFKDFGFNVPESIITSNNKDIQAFKNRVGRIITKPMSEVVTLNRRYQNEDNKMVMETKISMTNEVKSLDNFTELSFPSFFQQLIEKDFEIRSFYLNKKVYSMAIFSQKDKTTQVDFRNYNKEKPNRNIPFELPKSLENKLVQFCLKNKITTGSFDILRCKSGKYYFLELNPVGQFGMVSSPCNYKLEKKLAELLIKYTK